MGITIELPGGTAVLRSDEDLTNKQVKSLRRSARHAAAIATKLQQSGFDEKNPETWGIISSLTDEEDDVLDEFQRTAVVTRLESWTLPYDMPVNIDDVDNLPRNVYVPLTVAAADVKLSDDFSIEGGLEDPKALTADSESSEPPSVEASS